MITIEEFFNAVTNKNERGLSDTAIAFECDVVDIVTKERKMIASVSMQKPLISIQRHGNYVQIDFSFISALDNDLKLLWNAYELYGRTSSDVKLDNEKAGVFVAGNLTFVPMKFDGAYYSTAVDPVFWALTSKEVGSNASVLRVLYLASDFEIYENTEVDVKAIQAEANNELRYEARLAAEQKDDSGFSTENTDEQ